MRNLLVHIQRLAVVGIVVALQVTVDECVIVGPFPTLVFVHSDNLSHLGRPKGSNERSVVENKHDSKSDTGAPSGDGSTVSQLLGKLNPFAIQPSTWDLKVSVIVGNGSLGENTRQQRSDVTSEGVDREDIHHIVDAHRTLQNGGKVRYNSRNDTDQQSSRHADESGSWSDGNQTSNSTGAETDNRPLALQTEIKEHPSQTSSRRSEVGRVDRHSGTKIRTESGSTVETDPTHPEESGTENNVRNVVRLEEQSFGTVTVTRAKII